MKPYRGQQTRVKRVKSTIEKEFDYMNVSELKRFLTATGKIRARKLTGLTAKSQRSLTVAVKRARTMALLPYVVRPRAHLR